MKCMYFINEKISLPTNIPGIQQIYEEKIYESGYKEGWLEIFNCPTLGQLIYELSSSYDVLVQQRDDYVRLVVEYKGRIGIKQQ